MARNVQAWWLPIYLKTLFYLGNRFYKIYTKLAAFTVLAHRRPHLTQWCMLHVGTQITKNANSQNIQPLAFSAARVSHTKNTNKWRRLYAKTEFTYTSPVFIQYNHGISGTRARAHTHHLTNNINIYGNVSNKYSDILWKKAAVQLCKTGNCMYSIYYINTLQILVN